MGSPFDQVMASADRSINATFGEPVEILPRIAVPRGEPMPDINRRAATVRGVFMQVSRETMLEGTRSGTGSGSFIGFTAIAETAARVWLPALALRILGYQPVKDDAVLARGQLWVVVEAKPTDLGDVMLSIDPEGHTP